MSPRALWIVALGAALVVLTALNVFRPREQVVVGADAESSSFRAAGDEPTAQRPVGETRGSQPVEQRADAAEGREAPPEPQPVPASFPTPGRYASITAALADHDVSPDRRMPA